MGRKITLKHVQEVSVFRDGTSVDCWDTRQSDYALRKGYGAKRKVDPKTKQVFYVIKLDCSDCSIHETID